MGLGVLQVMHQRGIRNARGHQCHHGDDALGLHIDCLLIPDLTEEHIIIQVGKHRRKVSQLGTACGLGNFSFMVFTLLLYYPQGIHSPSVTELPAFLLCHPASR